jgi:hypothetical protein
MTKSIGIGDRVLFTNPSTGQQLIGTVEGYEESRPRPWVVKFDSFMFPDMASRNNTRALVSADDCVLLDEAGLSDSRATLDA